MIQQPSKEIIRLVVTMNEIHDRGMLKWQPFDSVTSTKQMVLDILKQKDYQVMPTLSEEQINDIAETILEGYYNKTLVKISYYYAGKIYLKITKIKYLNKLKEQIILSDQTIIGFKQIIKIAMI
jgi:hypothetical protein